MQVKRMFEIYYLWPVENLLLCHFFQEKLEEVHLSSHKTDHHLSVLMDDARLYALYCRNIRFLRVCPKQLSNIYPINVLQFVSVYTSAQTSLPYTPYFPYVDGWQSHVFCKTWNAVHHIYHHKHIEMVYLELAKRIGNESLQQNSCLENI